jgi:hypothetical protein
MSKEDNPKTDGFDKLKKAINEGKPDYITDKVYKNLIQYYKNISSQCTEDVLEKDKGYRNSDLSKASEIFKGLNIQKVNQGTLDCVVREIKYLIYAIENEYIDANKFLVWIIGSINDTRLLGRNDAYLTETFQMYLLMIALCLRYGANPNMYVVETGYGKIHLIVYTLIRLQNNKIYPIYPIEKDFVKQVILIMTLLGSNVNMKAIYDDATVEMTGSAKFNRKIVAEATKRVSAEAQNSTVNEFIKGVGYIKGDKGTFQRSAEKFGILDDNYEDPKIILRRSIGFQQGIGTNYTFSVDIGLLIDDPEFAIPKVGIKEFMPNFDLVLKYNAIRVLQNMSIDDNDSSSLEFHAESIRVLQSIESIALEGFVELLQRGFKMSYFTMNRLILKMKQYIEKGQDKDFDRVYSEVYLSMLKSAIALGVPMDKYQFDFINKMGAKDSNGDLVSDQIKETYKIPLWKKACTTSIKAKLPKTVKLYAASLGIGDETSKVDYNPLKKDFDFMEPTKQEVCTNLAMMMVKSEDEIKKEAMDRLKRRIESTTPKVGDLVLGRYTPAECANTDQYNENPLEYNDATLAYYRDSKENLYCFPSTMYKDLIETRVNPYTNEPLPTDLLIKMDKTNLIFSTLGIDMDKTVPVSVAFKKLKQDDQINNERTDYAKETISMLFFSRGIRKEWIESRKAKDFNDILSLSDINMAQSYLDRFDSDPSLRFATFCKALYSAIKRKPLETPKIMNEIIKTLKGTGKTTT